MSRFRAASASDRIVTDSRSSLRLEELCLASGFDMFTKIFEIASAGKFGFPGAALILFEVPFLCNYMNIFQT